MSDLEERQEGVHAGVQELLALARRAEAGPYADVCGMLADLIHVPVESARVVEAALGELAQAVVVKGERLLRVLRDVRARPTGRLTILPLEDAPLPLETTWSAMERQPGVIGRADRFVRCELAYAPLVRRLLGDTWVVESLEVAASLAELSGDQLRFVTVDGAVVERSGAVLLNAASHATGIISRRSELRQLTAQLQTLAQESDAAAQQVQATESQITELEEQCQRLADLARELRDEAADRNAQVRVARAEQARLEKQAEAAERDYQSAVARQSESSQLIESLQAQEQESQRKAVEAEVAIEAALARFADCEARHKACDLQWTSAKVELAKSEHHVEGLAARLAQIQ
ncbi:MAG: hypothetical protein KDA41_02445, partial [Planctomycetales bacterium]|nr:hypothetical protein [Planctomycetales bacterium]